MLNLIKRAQRQNNFFKDTLDQRKKNEEQYESHKDTLPPAFNKRLYSIQGSEGVVITGAAMEVMARNAANIGNLDYRLNHSDLLVMKCVVEGLKAIHRGLAFVKEVLSHVVTLESYEPMQYVKKKSNEEATFCYYILEGAVEATYDGSHGRKLQIYEPDLLYTHRAGEYMGLVTFEGEDKDMAPPATIYNQLHTQMLRIDRADFHKRISRLSREIDDEKKQFIDTGGTMLGELPEQQKRELIKFMSKEVYAANQVVIEQKQLTDFIYFIAEGHCDCVKMVYLPGCYQRVLLNIGHLETGQFCGEERVINDVPNYCTVITKSSAICFKIHRAAFETGGYLRNYLMKLIKKHRPSYPSVKDLRELGTATYRWEVYKRLEATKEDEKDIHEDRQRVLQNTNLKYDDTNVMLNFLKGDYCSSGDASDDETNRRRRSSLGLPNRHRNMLGSAVVAESPTHGGGGGRHESERPESAMSRGSDYIDDEAELRKQLIKEQKLRQKNPVKTYVEETKQVLDSRDLFKLFPGHIKPREGMLKLTDITKKKKVVVKEKKQPDLVALEPDEIVIRAQRKKEELAEKIAKKQRHKEHTEESESPFTKECELAYTHKLVAQYRTNVLERKLKRSKYVHEEELRRIRNKQGKDYIRLDLALKMGNVTSETDDTSESRGTPEQTHERASEDRFDENGDKLKRSKSWRRCSVALRRKKFVDMLTAKFSSENRSLPALNKHLSRQNTRQDLVTDKLSSPSFTTDKPNPTKTGLGFASHVRTLQRIKTMPIIKLS